MICFEFSRISGKNRKKGKPQNLGKHGPLRHSEGHPRCCVVLHRSEGLPFRGEAEGIKRPPPPPSATLQRVLRHDRHCSQRQNFRIFVPKVSYSYTDCLRTLIND